MPPQPHKNASAPRTELNHLQTWLCASAAFQVRCAVSPCKVLLANCDRHIALRNFSAQVGLFHWRFFACCAQGASCKLLCVHCLCTCAMRSLHVHLREFSAHVALCKLRRAKFCQLLFVSSLRTCLSQLLCASAPRKLYCSAHVSKVCCVILFWSPCCQMQVALRRQCSAHCSVQVALRTCLCASVFARVLCTSCSGTVLRASCDLPGNALRVLPLHGQVAIFQPKLQARPLPYTLALKGHDFPSCWNALRVLLLYLRAAIPAAIEPATARLPCSLWKRVRWRLQKLLADRGLRIQSAYVSREVFLAVTICMMQFADGRIH